MKTGNDILKCGGEKNGGGGNEVLKYCENGGIIFFHIVKRENDILKYYEKGEIFLYMVKMGNDILAYSQKVEMIILYIG